MAWFAPLLAVGGIVGAVGGVIWEKRRELKRLAQWRRLAKEMGARFYEPGGFWRAAPAAIEADIGVARVRLDTKIESSGDHTTVYMRGRVCFPLGAAPEFRIFKEGLLASIGNKLGRRDVELGGHRGFDERFVVRSRAELGHLRQLWTHEAKDLVCRHFDKAHFECDGTTLTFEEMGAYRDADKMRAAFELMGMLGQADLYGRYTLERVDDGSYSESSGPWDSRSRPFVALDLPSRVIVGAELTDQNLVTVARLQSDVRVDDIDLILGANSVHGDTGGLPPATRPYLARVGRQRQIRLRVENGRASLVWDRIAFSSEKIRQGAELLASLVPVGDGVFR